MRDRSKHVFRRFWNHCKETGLNSLLFDVLDAPSEDFQEAGFGVLFLMFIVTPGMVFLDIAVLAAGISLFFPIKDLTYEGALGATTLIVCVFIFNLFVAAIVGWWIKRKYRNDIFTFNHPYGYRLSNAYKHNPVIRRFECVYDKDVISETPISGKYCIEPKFVNGHQTTKENWVYCSWRANGEALCGDDEVNLRNATKAEFLAAKHNGTLDDYKFTVISKSDNSP